jgi:hypothetical protein
MSYLFDAANEKMVGTLATAITYPITQIAAVKFATHPNTNRWLMGLGKSPSSNSGSVSIRLSNGNTWTAPAFDDGGTADTANASPHNYDGVWVRVLAEFLSDTSRSIYVGSIGNTDTNVQSAVITGTLDDIKIGESFAGTTDLGTDDTLVAEVAIWNAELTTQQKTDALAGNIVTGIQPSLLVGYWPMSSDSGGTIANLGTDSNGDLTVTGATFDPDHPTIISASSRRRRTALMGLG